MPPDGWEELRTDRLLDAVVAFVRRFVVLSRAQADAVALWVLHTHAFTAADTTPYLSVTSAEKRSGKTRLLEVLELIVAQPWFTARTTAAALARKIAAEKPTLLLDESDAAFKGDKEYAETLRGVLNSGYKRGGRTTVCVVKKGGIVTQDLGTFGPKAIAGIGKLPDTVRDRSIAVRLERKSRDERTERFRRRLIKDEAADLRARAADWATPNLETLRDAWPELPEELDDRAQDVWEPLLAIADLAGGKWPERARRAAAELSAPGAREDESLGVRLLADLRGLFDQWNTDRAKTSDLVAALSAEEEAPWGHWRGKPLTGQTLAEFLKPFGVRSRTVWFGQGETAKGFLREQFEPVWQRYLPDEALSQGAVRPVRPSGSVSETASGLTKHPSGEPSGGSAELDRTAVRPSGAVRPEPASEAAPDGLTPLTAGRANGGPTDAEVADVCARHDLDLTDWPDHEVRGFVADVLAREAKAKGEA